MYLAYHFFFLIELPDKGKQKATRKALELVQVAGNEIIKRLLELISIPKGDGPSRAQL